MQDKMRCCVLYAVAVRNGLTASISVGYVSDECMCGGMFLQRGEDSPLYQPERRVKPRNTPSPPSCPRTWQAVAVTTLWLLQKKARPQFPLSQGQLAPDLLTAGIPPHLEPG